ncbi:MAG TPA: FAD-dependent oxidoreductase [Balneolaceae bacterium]|nr:FAD-dependent oxidoreductase [Balneolaceae bacterium]
MVIGIIGASISGLIAGKRLAQAGHDVTVIEKSRSLGGRLATLQMDGMNLDYGLSHFEVKTNTFQPFVDELMNEGDLKIWAEEFSLHDGENFYEVDPNAYPENHYMSPNGLQSVAKKLSRWVDVKSQEKAGGLTYIGPDRSKKRSWMINLTDISVFECDAVIIATPAVEAYGVLQTAQNRTATRRIIRDIDEITYDACFSLVATFDHEVPDWKGINCEQSLVKWIGNESSKQDAEKAGLLIQSTNKFFRENAQAKDEEVIERMLEETSRIIGPWALQEKTTYLHRWKYFKTRNPIDEYFMELEMEDAPLALIGDYLGGNSLENAFVSGYNLAEYWIKKYSTVTV